MLKHARVVTNVLLLLALVLRVKQLLSFGPELGFDAYSHIDYLEAVHGGNIPKATDMWQGYQPPLYYWISSSLAGVFGVSLKFMAQIVSASSGILAGIPLFFICRELLPGAESFAVLIFLTLPNSLLVSSMVYGMQTALLLVGVFLLLLTSAWRRAPDIRFDLSLGIVIGLTFLTRYDGLLLLCPVSLLFLKRWFERASSRLHAFLALVGTILTAMFLMSPILLRNIALYNDPLISNRHPLAYPNPLRESLNFPNYLAPSMFFDPGLTLWTRPHIPHLESVPAMLFGDLWGARYPATLPSQVMLFGGVVLTALGLWGGWLALKDKTWYPVLSVVLANVLMMGVVYRAMGDYSAYKSTYYYASFYFFALAIAAGRQQVREKWGESAALILLVPPFVFLLAFAIW